MLQDDRFARARLNLREDFEFCAMSVTLQASLEASDAPSSTSFGSSLSPKKVVSAEHPSNPVIPDEGPIQVAVFKEQLSNLQICRLMLILNPKLAKVRCPKDRDEMAR